MTQPGNALTGGSSEGNARRAVMVRCCGVPVLGWRTLWHREAAPLPSRGYRGSFEGYGVMLMRRAAAAASVRLVTPSLARMWEMCTLTVFSLMNRSWAMRRLLSPSASSVRTCRSVG